MGWHYDVDSGFYLHTVCRRGRVCAGDPVPRERLAEQKLETGSTFKFVFLVGDNHGATAAFGGNKAVSKENGLTMKPNWTGSPSCDVEWALVE